MIEDLIKDIDKLMEFHENGTPSSKLKEEYDDVSRKYLSFLNDSDRNRLLKEANEKNMGLALSKMYPFLVKKVKSTVYTPVTLADELCRNTPVNHGESLLDCSSGTGNLLVPFVEKHGDSINITANDTDTNATKIAMLELVVNHGIKELTKTDKDFLDMEGCFDVIIGNPPYSGHKDISNETKLRLKNEYSDVYSNKGDLYYAFFKKGFELLKPGGRLAFIVSRYFLEAESARGLRSFILGSFKVLFIHDFYGERPFGAGVDPCIIILEKSDSGILINYRIPVIREDVGAFEINSKDLNSDSMKLLTDEERKLASVIEESCRYKLGDMGRFAQGIITGFDKVFIKTIEEAEEFGIEGELLVPWIKSKDLVNYSDSNTKFKYLVYPDSDESSMNGFLSYAKGYYSVLSKRREVIKGTRKFYELTWGRIKEDFMKNRILFPFKAADSNFIMGDRVFHSADVYSLFLKDETQYDYILKILNSPIYNKYIKTKLKKLGCDLYEYYPHRLKGIWVPDIEKYPDPEMFLKMIAKKLMD